MTTHRQDRIAPAIHITAAIRLPGGRRAGSSAALASILAVFAFQATDSGAQVQSECSLRGADTLLASGVTIQKCLDLTSLNAKSVVIPSNVTRIDNGGFSLCESAEQSGGQADIVYVMDQSGSMNIRYVWISPNKVDTVYLEALTGCTNLVAGDANGHGSITLPNDAGTRQVPIMNPAKTTVGCRAFSGDPFTQRGISFKQAIDYQAARAPMSTAGFMGFAEGVLSPVRPVALNLPANITRLKAAMGPVFVNNTNYTAPLDTAKKWLLTPSITSNPTKGVIFLSDGQPTFPTNNPDGYLNVLDPAYPAMPGIMPPVYGIYMGRPSADTVKLSDLSKRTGGIFFLIPPSRPDSLKAVVERILNVILRQYQPTSAVVTNNSVAPPQVGRAGATDFTRLPDGQWQMSLDKPVGLKKLGDNAIDLKTEFVDVNSGALKPNNIVFTLNTTGPDESTNKNLPGTPFAVKCVDLPPPINVVKVAYIKDTDGDGAGDKVFFTFSRPLEALPSSIDSIYWNQAGAPFANKGKAALSFLAGSGNMVVIADLTLTPYPKGLTGIPEGAKPVGVLPPGGVFLSQRPAVQDSIGPILMTATIKPFDNSTARPGSEFNLDTIIVTASEGLETRDTWNGLLVWSKKSPDGQCGDYENALAVVPKEQPRQDAGSQTFTLLVPTGTGTPTPLAGDCVYLNAEGSYTDSKANLPPIYGVILLGNPPIPIIDLFRGYPPVVGITADRPGFLVVNNDPRKGDAGDYSTKDPGTGKYATIWVPPVGFTANVPFNPVIPLIGAPSVGTDPQVQQVLPAGISTVQVVSTDKYIVDVNIFDNNGVLVRKLRQAFGYNGELNNRNRISNRGLVSYLVWDLKDAQGQKAGQGVYIWKAVFRFNGGKEEVRYTKTGVVRPPGWDLTN